jgi:hypothetical protein
VHCGSHHKTFKYFDQSFEEKMKINNTIKSLTFLFILALGTGANASYQNPLIVDNPTTYSYEHFNTAGSDEEERPLVTILDDEAQERSTCCPPSQWSERTKNICEIVVGTTFTAGLIVCFTLACLSVVCDAGLC